MPTPNYNIPTLNTTDTIDLVKDINAMMNAIDTALHGISTDTNPELEQLKTTVSQIQSTVTAMQLQISTYEKITTYGDLDQYGALTTKEA
nr:MAG: hypothetical protein [Bacteriophage sp.]